MNLLFHQGSLGDWVLVLPTVCALARQHGTTAVITGWSKAKLTARMIEKTEPVDIDCRDGSRMHAPDAINDLSAKWIDMCSNSKIVISFVSDGDDAWADNMHKLAPHAQYCFVQPRPDVHWDQHVQRWQLKQLRDQGLDLTLPPPLSDTARPGRSPGNRIVIQPGSGGKQKCWAVDRFEHVLDHLRRQGSPVLGLLGPVETDTWPKSQLDKWTGEYQSVLADDLDDLYNALSGAGAFLGNDSGPSHLAAWMGLHTICLFGPTKPQVWAPQGRSVTVLAPPQPESMTWLQPDTVLAALAVTMNKDI